MAFRNNKTMVAQELGRIAGTMHHAWGIRNPSGERSIFDKPLEFNAWLLKGMNRSYEKFGTEYETVAPGLLRIIPKHGKPFLRTKEDFVREYEDYKVDFYL